MYIFFYYIVLLFYFLIKSKQTIKLFILIRAFNVKTLEIYALFKNEWMKWMFMLLHKRRNKELQQYDKIIKSNQVMYTPLI
jgi:hypothetical protein